MTLRVFIKNETSKPFAVKVIESTFKPTQYSLYGVENRHIVPNMFSINDVFLVFGQQTFNLLRQALEEKLNEPLEKAIIFPPIENLKKADSAEKMRIWDTLKELSKRVVEMDSRVDKTYYDQIEDITQDEIQNVIKFMEDKSSKVEITLKDGQKVTYEKNGNQFHGSFEALKFVLHTLRLFGAKHVSILGLNDEELSVDITQGENDAGN